MKCPHCGLWFREESEPRLRCLTHQMMNVRQEPHGCCHIGCTIIDSDGREIEATRGPWCVVINVFPEFAQ